MLGYFLSRLRWRVIWSIDGWRHAWKTEHSFRTWVWANVVSDVLAFSLPIGGGERLVIVVIGVLILAAELLNTAIEALADLVDGKPNPAIKACKDMGSAAVAITALAGGVAWLWALFG